MKKRTVRIIAIIIAAMLVLGIAGPYVYLAFSEPASDSQMTNFEDISSNEDELRRIDAQIKNIQNNIATLESAVKNYKDKAKQADEDLKAAEAEETKFRSEFGERFRKICESGNTSYIKMFFNAESPSDLTDRSVAVREIADYDKKVLNDFKTVKDTLKAAKDNNEEISKKYEENVAELANAKSELETKKAERKKYLN